MGGRGRKAVGAYIHFDIKKTRANVYMRQWQDAWQARVSAFSISTLFARISNKKPLLSGGCEILLPKWFQCPRASLAYIRFDIVFSMRKRIYAARRLPADWVPWIFQGFSVFHGFSHGGGFRLLPGPAEAVFDRISPFPFEIQVLWTLDPGRGSGAIRTWPEGCLQVPTLLPGI